VVIACGALGGPIREIAARRGWPVELHCLPAVLHNRPAAIAPQVERLAVAAQARGLPVAIGYADCGTYGALDELSARLGLRRLPGLHCYDLLAGPDRVAALFEAEPGTYVLTDFLVRSFRRTVLAGLGLDRYPELWPDYFGHYRRVVWLAQSRDPALDAEAEAVAAQFGLPLTVIDTGTARLEHELELLLTTSPAPAPAGSPQADSPAPAGSLLADSAAPAGPVPVPDPLADADSSPAPLLPPAPPTTSALAGDVVINRLVTPGQHQSVDHESRPTAAATPQAPRVTAAPQDPEVSATEAERCAAG
jgi:hypothetical protein